VAASSRRSSGLMSQIEFWGNIGSLQPQLGISERDGKGEKGRSSGGEEATRRRDLGTTATPRRRRRGFYGRGERLEKADAEVRYGLAALGGLRWVPGVLGLASGLGWEQLAGPCWA
jgi:hypothetical protein